MTKNRAVTDANISKVSGEIFAFAEWDKVKQEIAELLKNLSENVASWIAEANALFDAVIDADLG